MTSNLNIWIGILFYFWYLFWIFLKRLNILIQQIQQKDDICPTLFAHSNSNLDLFIFVRILDSNIVTLNPLAISYKKLSKHKL